MISVYSTGILPRVLKNSKAMPRIVTLSASEESQPRKTEILRSAQNDIFNTLVLPNFDGDLSPSLKTMSVKVLSGCL